MFRNIVYRAHGIGLLT